MTVATANNHLSLWTPRPNALTKESLSPSVTLYGLPAISIVPLTINKQQQLELETADAYLFVSQHAVKQLLKQLSIQSEKQRLDIFSAKKIIAIGEKTATVLRNHGLTVDIIANAPHSSESLLSMPSFQQLPYQQIAIICGQDGRSLLQKMLTEQEKKVYRITCYRRDKCDLSAKTMLKFINEYSIAGAIVTSCHIADAMHAVLSKLHQVVFDDPVFALSKRIGDYLSSLGFTKVIVAQKATQQSLNQTIITWWDSRE